MPTARWPEWVLSYEDSPDFPAFEAYYDELVLPFKLGLI